MIISKRAKGDSTLSGQLYQMFFFERILERLSKSQYRHNIILKGGLLLSSIIGDDERTTKDMDATLKSMPLEKENIHIIFKKILSIDLKDDVTFEILDIKDIREEDEYECIIYMKIGDIYEKRIWVSTCRGWHKRGL